MIFRSAITVIAMKCRRLSDLLHCRGLSPVNIGRNIGHLPLIPYYQDSWDFFHQGSHHFQKIFLWNHSCTSIFLYQSNSWLCEMFQLFTAICLCARRQNLLPRSVSRPRNRFCSWWTPSPGRAALRRYSARSWSPSSRPASYYAKRKMQILYVEKRLVFSLKCSFLDLKGQSHEMNLAFDGMYG